jgi:YD repeat-containing protein
MRRFAAGLLLFVLMGQSSGTALAMTSSGDGQSLDLRYAVRPILNVLRSSQLVAQLTGLGERYASDTSMPRVAYPKRFTRPAEINIAPSRLAKMYAREGKAEVRVLPKAPPTTKVRDTRALPRSRSNLPVLKPGNLIHATGATSPRSVTSSVRGLQPGNTPQSLKRAAVRGGVGGSPSSTATGGSSGGIVQPQIKASTDVGAGINPWWTFEDRSIPGIGSAMVNVGTGNLVLQATDVDIPERGLDLVVRRTYNSQSLHDASGDDGSEPGVYGNGWTNTYDAHLVFQSNGSISVYDIDGTRCDYAPDGSGNWIACAGEHAILEPDPHTACAYWWVKKNGTAYYFYSESENPNCQTATSNVGRLYEIVGRNNNNSIALTYSWVPNQPETSQNITQLVVAHSDGQSLTMDFAQAGGGSGPNEVADVKYPDPDTPGQYLKIRYSYDAQGDLQEVDKPGNDAANVSANRSILSNNNVPSGDLPETYGIQHPMQFACGPRATISKWSTTNPNSDGACLNFDYDSNVNLIDWKVNGVLNPTSPGDGQTTLQPGIPTGWLTWYTQNFVYGAGGANPACTQTAASSTTMCDTDGHASNWVINSNANVTQTTDYTGGSPTKLTTQAVWDANNNLTASIDANLNETDYAYDVNGNTIAVALPKPTTGSGRPTSVYSYDSHNNLTSYCDPVYAHNNGLQWSSLNWPAGQECPVTNGTTHYVWTIVSGESYGRLTDAYTACYSAGCTDAINGKPEPGYHRQFLYNANGLVTSVLGDVIANQLDGNSRTPTQTFVYDGFGNLQTFSNGGGTWNMTYDGLNRLTQRQDPDVGHPTSYFQYNPDGSPSLTETPYQHSVSKGNAFTHDADGDVASRTVHRKGTQAETDSYYDGLDRLISVVEPHDASYDAISSNWITRYFYDLSMGGTVQFNGSTPFSAYGNAFETVELLPSGNSLVYSGNPLSSTGFRAIKGIQYDALDREVISYSVINQANAESTTTYDAAGALDLMYKQCQPPPGGGQTLCKTFGYDNDNRLTTVSYTDPNSSQRTYTYDLDGHPITSANGDGTLTTSYDPEGRVVNVQEPQHGTSPATYTHELYADGKLKRIDISSSALTDSGNIFAYSYNNQGAVETQPISYAKQGASVNLIIVYAYTSAGRLSQRSETGSSANPTSSQFSYDTYGQLNQVAFPAGTLSNYAYDPEGDLTAAGSQQFNYSIRGDLYQTQPLPSQGVFGGPSSIAFANGVQVQSSGAPYKSTWDPVMGTMLSTDNNVGLGNESGSSFGYDGAGRLTGDGSISCINTCSQVVDPPTTSYTNIDQYDGDNHLIQTAQAKIWQNTGPFHNQSGETSNLSVYDWGPNDHPIKIGSANLNTGTPAFDTLHWDGDRLMFTTNPGGNVDDIKIGTMADITPLDGNFAGITTLGPRTGRRRRLLPQQSGSRGAGRSRGKSVAKEQCI